jgi:hypothetical protein
MLKRDLSDELLKKVVEKARSSPRGRKKIEEWNVLIEKLPSLMELDEKATVTFFEKYLPENWRVAYPRIYSDIRDYYSPKRLASWLMTSCVLSAMGQLKHPDKPSASCVQEGIVTIFSIAQRYSIPQLFVGREMLEAILRTDVPKDLKWWEIKFPFPAGFLFIPRGALKSPEGTDVAYIGWAFLGPGDFVQASPRKCYALQIAVKIEDSIGTTYTKVIDSELDKNLFDLRMESVDPNEDPYSLPMDKTEDEFVVRILRLTLSILMIPSAREELFERERRDKVVRKGDNLKEFWTPNYIGRKYLYEKTKESKGGSHQSPRAHWRRGHYRNQRHGEQRSQTKIIWIEPILVMGENE